MSDADKPKIIIDEDWKAQVEAEKLAARAIPLEAANAEPRPATASSESAVSPKTEQPEIPLPPPSLTFLFTTLATQSMIALGQVPSPITGKVEMRLQQAKHFIDTLTLLEAKTAGNRTADETALLSDLLHQLRMAYVMTTQSGSSYSN